jgi:hypothetical protein
MGFTHRPIITLIPSRGQHLCCLFHSLPPRRFELAELDGVSVYKFDRNITVPWFEDFEDLRERRPVTMADITIRGMGCSEAVVRRLLDCTCKGKRPNRGLPPSKRQRVDLCSSDDDPSDIQ